MRYRLLVVTVSSFGLSDLTVVPTLDSEDDMSPEQLRVNLLFGKILEQREEHYNDITEIDHESDSDTVDYDDECAID